MNKMSQLWGALFVLLSLLVACHSSKDSTPKNPSYSLNTTAADTFPNGWLGTYEGVMLLQNPGYPVGELKVQLELEPTDTLHRWIWRMTYYGKPPMGTMVKDYRLVRKSPTVYAMDEGGGLELREDYIGDTFYSNFSLGKPGEQTLYTSYFKKINAHELWFEVTAVPLNPVDTVVGDIGLHPLITSQKVLLKRKS